MEPVVSRRRLGILLAALILGGTLLAGGLGLHQEFRRSAGAASRAR